VIFVREGSSIDDLSVLIFTKTFYTNLFNGSLICDAFELAKSAVYYETKIEAQANMFHILLKE
jgi:hypothetical protein